MADALDPGDVPAAGGHVCPARSQRGTRLAGAVRRDLCGLHAQGAGLLPEMVGSSAASVRTTATKGLMPSLATRSLERATGPATVFLAEGLTKTYTSGTVAVHALRGIDLEIR